MSEATFPPVPRVRPQGIRPMRWLLARLLSRVVAGEITVMLPDGQMRHGAGRSPGPRASVVLHRWRAVRRLVLGGDTGFAEAFIDGDWSTPDLPALLCFGAVNQDAIGVDGSRAVRLLRRLGHRRRANTCAGSRRNIPAHYDIGNEFYAAWLDAGMTYSAALFTHPGQRLEAAQDCKLDAVIAALDLTGRERVLEIGCGWGSLAERIAARARHVTGLTLSPAQLNYANARLDDAGLGARAELRLQDYREVAGQFDRIVSVEMLEAVGEAYWPEFFGRIAACLAPGGVAVLQFISIADARFAAYRDGVDFIQKHIFPGGMLPSVPVLHAVTARAGLTMQAVRTFAPGYAATLAHWRTRLHAAWPALRGQGFDERFRRKWEYYLAYCEAGFHTGLLDVGIYRLRHATG